MVTDYQQVVPTQVRCIHYLAWIEEAFECSINFWVKVEHRPGRLHPISLLATGSGNLFDLLTPGECVVTSPILHADRGSIYPALWACLTMLEHRFEALSRAKIPRPSL